MAELLPPERLAGHLKLLSALRERALDELQSHITVQAERIKALEAEAWKEHRPVLGVEHDPVNGKIHGCCCRCGQPWPCEWAPESTPSTRITALEAALKPFAALAEHIFEGEPDDKALIACLAEPDEDPEQTVFTIGDVRRAAEVYEKLPGGGQGG